MVDLRGPWLTYFYINRKYDLPMKVTGLIQLLMHFDSLHLKGFYITIVLIKIYQFK